MLVNGSHLLPLPRYLLVHLFLVALAASLMSGPLADRGRAKEGSKFKKIKQELVRIQTDLDAHRVALRRFGKRWDQLEAESSERAKSFSGFAASRVGAAEQAYVETLILHAREAIRASEEHQDETIERLDQIVAERQAKQLEKSGVEAATMPSLTVGGSLITYSADWEKTAMCESTKRWHIDSRYDGGLQFDPITWIEFGGAEFARYAYQASKIEQIAVAERVLIIQGPGAWPNCFTPLPADS